MANDACFETIRVTNGVPENMEEHTARFRRTQQELFGVKQPNSLKKLGVFASLPALGVYKCRLVYTAKIESVELSPYAIRPVNSLRMVRASSFSYRFKFVDRREIEVFFSQRGTCDDILLVVSGRVTDTSICNIALFDGKRWVTPSEPLLPGTQRAALLKREVLVPEKIFWKDKGRYEKIRLFNAMIPWEQAITLPLDSVLG